MLEILGVVSILREHLPELKIRVVNVVDLMKLQSCSEHPHGLSESDSDSLFAKDERIIFGFHGYPWLVHRLTYRRTNRILHVRGYMEEGMTTPFDMGVQNELDRYHLVLDVIDRLPQLITAGAYLKQKLQLQLQPSGRCRDLLTGIGNASGFPISPMPPANLTPHFPGLFNSQARCAGSAAGWGRSEPA